MSEMQEAMNDAQEVFGEKPTNSSNNSNGGPRISDFMKKTPFQKSSGFFGLITNMMIMSLVVFAWLTYGIYYIGAKAVYFVVNMLKKN